MKDQNTEQQYAGLRKHSTESKALVKECLQTALLTLMKEKDYRQVSITELCRKAGVSRMAFYRNYEGIDELVREAAEGLNRMVLDAVGSPFRRGTDLEWYREAFQLVKEHKDDLKIMFEESFQAEWMNVVNQLALHDESFSVEKRYQRLCWCGGFENVVCVWLNTGMKESPEEMAEYCLEYLPHMLKEAAQEELKEAQKEEAQAEL